MTRTIFSLARKNADILLAVVLFVGLFAMSIILYKERVCYMDVSFQLSEIIRTNTLAIQVNRFGAAFVQLFALLGRMSSLPLWVIGLLYSCGVVIYQWLIWVYIRLVNRDVGLSYAYLMYLTLLCTHLFFWIQSEYSQAIPFVFFYFSYTNRLSWGSSYLRSFWLLIPLTIILVFFHPLVFPLFVWMSLLMFLFRSNQSEKRVVVANSLLASLVFGIKEVYFKNWYDEQAKERMKGLWAQLRQGIRTESFDRFLSDLQGIYLVFALLLILFVWQGIYQKKYMGVAIVVLTILASLLFFTLTHPTTERFYMENMFLSLSFMLSVGFLFFITLTSRKANLLLLFLITTCLFRYAYISRHYHKRLGYMRELITTYDNQKVILSEKHLDKQYIEYSWPLAYEIWMLSTIERGRSTSITATHDIRQYDKCHDTTHAFVGIHIHDYNTLPSAYFIFQDTVSSYKMIE